MAKITVDEDILTQLVTIRYTIWDTNYSTEGTKGTEYPWGILSTVSGVLVKNNSWQK